MHKGSHTEHRPQAARSAVSGTVRGTLATARGSTNGDPAERPAGSARCGRSPFYEPRAVASVPRTESEIADSSLCKDGSDPKRSTVRGTLATARGSKNGGHPHRALRQHSSLTTARVAGWHSGTRGLPGRCRAGAGGPARGAGRLDVRRARPTRSPPADPPPV